MTQLVGILNLTPDSFSSDGISAEAAIAQIDAMIADGASVIDIGAESTRPGATLLSPEQEWARLAPVIEKLGDRLQRAQFSVDTRHAATAQKALTCGVQLINDVSGGDAAMLELLRHHECRIILMHSLSIPADPAHILPAGCDAVAEVLAWAKAKIASLESIGIARERIILDPGIGFGKTAEQSWALIQQIAQFKMLGTAVMTGHSRKSFLSLFTDKKAPARDPETLAVSWYLAEQGVDYLRVHDVKCHAAMLRIRAAL